MDRLGTCEIPPRPRGRQPDRASGGPNGPGPGGSSIRPLMRLLIGAGTPKEAVAGGWCFLALLPTTDGAPDGPFSYSRRQPRCASSDRLQNGLGPSPGLKNHFVNGLIGRM